MTPAFHRLLLLTIIILGLVSAPLISISVGNQSRRALWRPCGRSRWQIPDRKIPLLVAGTCSVFALSDVFPRLSRFPTMPLWMGLE